MVATTWGIRRRRRVKITPEDIGESIVTIWVLVLVLVIFLAPFVTLGMIVSYLWGLI